MPKSKFAANQMCSHCSRFWGDNDFTMRIRSQSAVYNSKVRKLISKLDEAQSQNKPELLSRKQKRRAKWLKKRTTSCVELYCNLCKRKTIIRMQKLHHKKTVQAKDNNIKTEPSAIPQKTTKKKKKKKSPNVKNSGLPTITKECKTSNASSTKPEIKSIDKKQSNQMKNVNKNTNIPVRPPVKQIKVEKTAVKTHNMQASANIARKAKTKLTMSKTQSDNSLLRLAALLKSQRVSSINSNGCENSDIKNQQQRLAAFLK